MAYKGEVNILIHSSSDQALDDDSDSEGTFPLRLKKR